MSPSFPMLRNLFVELSGLGQGRCIALQQPLQQQPGAEGHGEQTGAHLRFIHLLQVWRTQAWFDCLPNIPCSRAVLGGCGMTRCEDRLSHLSSPLMLTVPQLLTEVSICFIVFIHLLRCATCIRLFSARSCIGESFPDQSSAADSRRSLAVWHHVGTGIQSTLHLHRYTLSQRQWLFFCMA